MVKYTSTQPVPELDNRESSGGDLNTDDDEPDHSLATHHKALDFVLSKGAKDHHLLSHTAHVLHDLISDHMPSDKEELGKLVANRLHKLGIHRHDKMMEGGSFWSDIGKGISKAWKATTKFVGKHAKDIGKVALDAAGVLGSAAATALGNPELVPVIEGAAQIGKKAIGGALPLEHIVGALKDVAHAHCPQSKAKLLHKDFVMTRQGRDASPILAALHFAHKASKHIKPAVLS